MAKRNADYYLYICEILELRKEGISFSEIGRRYGKDHTTIMHHCQKWGIHPPPIPTFDEERYQSPQHESEKPHKYDHLLNEKINPGKRYSFYLREAKKKDKWYAVYGSRSNFTWLATYKKKKGSKPDAEGDDVVPGEL